MESKFQQRLRDGLPASVVRAAGRLRGLAVPEFERIRPYFAGASQRLAERISGPAGKALPAVQTDTGLVLGFGLVAAVSGYLAINAFAIAPFQQKVDHAAGEVSSILTESIDRQIAVAESAAALFSGPDARVSRWAFLEFARTLPEENPGLSAVEWIPRVTAGQRSDFEKAANADGLFDFQFAERSRDGNPIPARRRGEYYPVYFVEPYVGNETILGIDLAANETFANLLAQVRDTGKTVAATGGLISRGDADTTGISIVVPVYRSSIVPVSVPERRAALSGFIRANFSFDRLLEALPSRVPTLPDLEVYIFDRGEAENPSLLHVFSSQQGALADQAISAKDAYRGKFSSVEYEAAGQQWNIVVKAVPDAFQGFLGLTAWGFVAFTLLLTALLMRHLVSMRQAREQAEAANRAKSEFLAMMGHELRTPLNAVIGFSEMMVNQLFGPLSNKHYEQYTTHIYSSATHLLALINNILDFSKIEDGSYILHKEDFDLAENWRSALTILEANIDASGVDVADEIATSRLKLHADPVVFRQVLLNLVSNAIKFTDRGGRVTVRAGIESDGRLALRVADTGIGIAKEDLDLVFKPFQQVDASLSRKYEGIGVGLPLARKLIELHGGALQIDSRIGEGTEVTVTFPGAIVIADGAPHQEPTPAALEDGPAAGITDQPKRKAAGSR